MIKSDFRQFSVYLNSIEQGVSPYGFSRKLQKVASKCEDLSEVTHTKFFPVSSMEDHVTIRLVLDFLST